MALPRILLIDDDNQIHKIVISLFQEQSTVVVVTTLAEAECVIELMSGVIDIAVIDACLGGGSPNTLRLPARLRELGFQGPIVGTFLSPLNEKPLTGAGCTQVCHKTQIFATIEKLLEASKPNSGAPSSK